MDNFTSIAYFLLVLLPVICTIALCFIIPIFFMGTIKPSVRWGKREVKVRQDYEAREIGWLLDELEFGNRYTRPLTLEALASVLPELTDADAHRITPRRRETLHVLIDSFVSVPLSSAQEVQLCLATLKALEKVGEDSDEWHVKNLALSARVPQIREAALAALPLLQARIAASSTMLLRASQEPAFPAESLLRPVQQHLEDQPETLLRPR
jgi:hypothetical protein